MEIGLTERDIDTEAFVERDIDMGVFIERDIDMLGVSGMRGTWRCGCFERASLRNT